VSYVTTIRVSAGDYGYDLEFLVVDEEGKTVDLSGASIEVVFEKRGEKRASFTKRGTIVDALSGKFKITIEQGDLEEAGVVYDVKARIYYSSGRVTAKGVTVIVEE